MLRSARLLHNSISLAKWRRCTICNHVWRVLFLSCGDGLSTLCNGLRVIIAFEISAGLERPLIGKTGNVVAAGPERPVFVDPGTKVAVDPERPALTARRALVRNRCAKAVTRCSPVSVARRDVSGWKTHRCVSNWQLSYGCSIRQCDETVEKFDFFSRPMWLSNAFYGSLGILSGYSRSCSLWPLIDRFGHPVWSMPP